MFSLEAGSWKPEAVRKNAGADEPGRRENR